MSCTHSTHVPWSSGEAFRGIDWVICMCCRRSWNVSRNTCWWMCLWPGSQPVRAGVGAGNALTASRLLAWHQNRWMPLIVNVCNVFNSIIPFPLMFSFFLHLYNISFSFAHEGKLAKSWSCTVYSETAGEVVKLFVTLREPQHLFLGVITTI